MSLHTQLAHLTPEEWARVTKRAAQRVVDDSLRLGRPISAEHQRIADTPLDELAAERRATPPATTKGKHEANPIGHLFPVRSTLSPDLSTTFIYSTGPRSHSTGWHVPFVKGVFISGDAVEEIAIEVEPPASR